MGRNSASHLAAQHQLSAGRTAVGAAKYVGSVGALAVAMGVGAAMSGGAGIAYADGTTDNGGAGGTSAQSSPAAAETTTKTDDSPTNGPTGHAPDESTSTTVPKMQGLTAGVPIGAKDVGDRPASGAEPDSLGGFISRIPGEIAALFGGAVPAAHAPTDAAPIVQSSPQISNRFSDRPSVKDKPSSADGSEVAVIRTDDIPTASADDARPFGVVTSSPVEPSRQRRLTAPPVTTAASRVVTTVATPTRVAPAQVAPTFFDPIATVVSGFLNALGLAPTASAGTTPVGPIPLVLGVLHLISREIERIFAYQPPSTAAFTAAEAFANAHPALASTAPDSADEVATAYGDIGKWMLEPDKQISDYGGHPYQGKQLLESVNVIIVDPTSGSPEQAAQRLNAAMFLAGFPAQPIHTTGFLGTIDDVTYGQQPTGLLAGFSNNFFVLPNDHGRIFGPDPVETSTGYVWSGAFSTETLALYNFLPGHAYVSSDMARTALATQLIRSGQATFVGMVPLDNTYDTGTTTTGDHDGYAVVLQLK